MKRTRHTTEQINEKLRLADVALGNGQKVPEICIHAVGIRLDAT